MSRALASAGVAVLAAGLAAGSTGHQIERDLEVAGVERLCTASRANRVRQ
jgi:fructose-1-phosphate kinase PfkB-like protein